MNFIAEEARVYDFLKQVNHVTSQVQGTNAIWVVMWNQICGLMIELSLPSFYVMINPTDIYNPIIKFLAGDDIDIDCMTADQVPVFWSQSILVANNPVVCAKFFHLYINTFLKTLFGFRGVAIDSDVGVLGCVVGYYGCVEAQGCGSLHCHMLVWLVGSLNLDEIKERITCLGDMTFKNNLIAFLEDSISTLIPDDPIPNDEIPSLDGDPELVQQCLQKDVYFLAQSCQQHCHIHTCFKYWWGPPEPRKCRFGLDEQNYCSLSTVDGEIGEINLHCLDGLINQYNKTMLAAVCYNMDIQFIESGQFTKANFYYVTDYITKT